MRILFFIIHLFGVMLSYAQESVTLLFVGDLMQHDAQIKAARKGDGYDYSACFKHAAKEIGKADLAIGNLEVTLGGKPYRGYPAFSAPDEYLYAIRDAGFDVLLTANNHCLDRGQKGLERTVRMLDSLGIAHAGTYANAEQRDRDYPLLVEENGIRIALLNYTYDTNGLLPTAPNVVNYIDREQIKKDIHTARQMRPDVIIACMHWGLEYHSLPRKEEKELAYWLIAQGVNHVIGSHPHVLQPMEVRKSARMPDSHVVVYSLGNFISNMSQVDTDGGAMVRLQLKKQYGITRLVSCDYSLVWTSRPVLNGGRGYELYPAHFISQPIKNEELIPMKRFLNNSRTLFQKHNKNIKEYVFE